MDQNLAADMRAETNWGTQMNISSVAPGNMPRPLYLLHEVITHRQLSPLFQPVIDLKNNIIFGHEGLIRGPVNSDLHAPLELFKAAREYKVAYEIEHLSRQIVLELFASQQHSGKLFINISPEILVQPGSSRGATLAYIHKLGLNPNNVIIELTESSPTFDYVLLRQAVDHYRSLGFEIAIDDLGEGFSSLRLWSELRPDYVKIDKHFIQGIDTDPIKLEFVRSIQQIAENSGGKVIAEGIETQTQLAMIKDLGVAYGQGYFLGRPAPNLVQELTPELRQVLNKKNITVPISANTALSKRDTLAKLIDYVTPVASLTTVEEIYELFEKNPRSYSLPVVDNDLPVGMISRHTIFDRLSRQYARELYAKKPCSIFMDKQPLIVEKSMSLQAISNLITNMEPHHLSNGFIITEAGHYLGVSSGHALLREITRMQINAARYANPLTLLPGNVPINEHMDRLLEHGISSWACYCDLDNFKPFNDVYGFRRGDELIQYTGKLLQSHVQPELDFVGHIGGDDFIVLFQSEDWEIRCRKILHALQAVMPDFYDAADRTAGGIYSEDRQGNRIFHSFATMSMGIVRIDSMLFRSHHEISAAIAVAKKQAKATKGNSLFLERRISATETADMRST
jgi:EAL domain-containing protein (putative c-di-GMP-specific phosphodiesterase class I)/GGDEF domain-containing protein/CBS domain-containing protein